MNRSIGNLVLPDELVLDVHLDMILVAEVTTVRLKYRDTICKEVELFTAK